MTKDAIRKRFICKRANFSTRYKKLASHSLTQHCLSYLARSPYNIVALYYPLVNECDTKCLITLLNKQGYVVLLPKAMSTQEMIFTKYTGALQRGKFGFESTSDESLYPEIIFVPLVAYDHELNRLGYGKGFYDRYLSEHNAKKVGLAFSKQRYKQLLPHDPHDIKLDGVITELGGMDG